MNDTKLECHREKARVRHPPQVHRLNECRFLKPPIVAWGTIYKTSDMYTSVELKDACNEVKHTLRHTMNECEQLNTYTWKHQEHTCNNGGNDSMPAHGLRN